MDAWIARLTHADDAGYYRTEPAEEEQSPFPWQSKICRDSPFWVNSICQVHAEYRSASAHTCSYFDPHNRERAHRASRSASGRVSAAGGNGSTTGALRARPAGARMARDDRGEPDG